MSNYTIDPRLFGNNNAEVITIVVIVILAIICFLWMTVGRGIECLWTTFNVRYFISAQQQAVNQQKWQQVQSNEQQLIESQL